MFGFKITQKEILERMDFYRGLKNAPIKYPKKLQNPHYITQNTKRYLLDNERGWKDNKTIYLGYHGNKEYVHRVLCLTEFLVRFLEFQGYTFKIDRNGKIYCDIKGIQIHFNFRQATKRVPDDSNKFYKSYKNEETDKLIFQMYESSYDRKEWADTPKIKLEDKVLHIIAYTELYCEYELEEIKKRAAYRKQMEVEKQKQDEIKRLIQVENEKVANLISSTKKWEQTEKILTYLDKRKVALIQNNLFTDEERDYYEWGLKIVDKMKLELLGLETKNL
ncbi:hypothetical protein [Flavobacterium sp. I3-2]|uniref:hypothetical protein n=1 Tax=Flavobacterium sp. I3-2 TaxID=2748319 RepID=UPI0015B26A47|nr:hypothetical protein [Flavobacterium sp. I3-2]